MTRDPAPLLARHGSASQGNGKARENEKSQVWTSIQHLAAKQRVFGTPKAAR